MKIRLFFSCVLLIGLFILIGFIFWSQELKYALPTPIPRDYVAVPIKATVNLPELDLPVTSGLYLHFYNPDCPCSKFNAKHVRDLIRSYGDSIRAYIVVPTQQDVASAKKEFENVLRIVADPSGRIAKACGVYSTPQAVIINAKGQLYYRGNYNRARYCTAKATNYAELALLSLLNNASPPVFDNLATQSYGCSLPSIENNPSFIQN